MFDLIVLMWFHIQQSSSNMDDETPGLTWLVGMIEEKTGRIKLEIVPNRISMAISDLFKRHISPETTVITDGHKSNPSAVQSLKAKYIIVNHSVGFKNLEGFHTNNIENLWSLIKYEVKKA